MTIYDVVVAGGGPAGAFTARELARAGLSVMAVDPRTSRPRLEGLGERVVELLRARGLHGPLDAVSAPVTRAVSWAGLAGSSNGERLVQRAVFDTEMRHAAECAGARSVKARVDRVLAASPEHGVRLKLSTGETVSARLMVDARGRQAPSAQRRKGPRTLAISGLLADRVTKAGTFVMATPEGWMWRADHPKTSGWVQICIDADDLSGTGRAALEDRMVRFLNQDGVRSQFGEIRFQSPLQARAAGLVLSAPELRLPVIPVGDAAVAIDPLSGHGLFWALSSALAAVPGVLTVLETPVRGRDLARRFHRSRVVDTFWRQARIGRDFYRLEPGLARTPFWAPRVAWPDDHPAHPQEGGVTLDRRVVVDNNRLVERDVLITPQDPGGVAFVAGIPVTALMEFIGKGAASSVPATPSAALRTALGWMESRGLLGHPEHENAHQRIKMRDTA